MNFDINYDIPTIITKRNVDSMENPIGVKLLEKKQVMDNHSCIVLSQIPDENYRITIEGFNEVFNSDELGNNNFYVSYSQGVVHFSPRYHGKTVVIEYYGIGYELISASRVFYKYDKRGNVIETLEEILDNAKEQLELIKTLGDSVRVIEKLEMDLENGKVLHDNLENDIEVGTPLQENLHSDIVEAKKWKDQLHQDVTDGKVLQPLLQQTVDDAEDIKVRLDNSIADAQEDIAIIEATGNKEILIQSSQWTLRGDIYEKEITHDLNSENLHVTAKNSNTKEAVTIGYKIIDKTRILLKSDEPINMSIILSASYYHAVQNISDDICQEVVKSRKGETSLDVKITKIDEQLDNITNQINEPYHYYVGVNQKYKTITEAFNEWLKHKQPTIIHILSGIYYEFIKYTDYCNCSFIGECKETTIVYSRSGKYEEAPITVQGDLTIENLTLKVDSSENSNFTENTNPAYALHIDSPNVEGTTVVRNCDLISYVNAGLGCGTRQNQTIILEDVNIYNYRDIGDHRYKMGMLYHNSATNGHINQNIKMKNVKAYSKNGRALMIYSYNTDDTKAQFEAVNTKLLSDVYEGNDVYFYNKDTSDNVIITGLEINDGSCKEVSDCNLAPNGNFKCNGATGGLNMPFPRWGIGNTISFDKETFKIQTIYDITKNFECYQRTKNATVWSDWERIDSKYAKNSNDSNLCLSNGLYLTNVNTPTSDQFMIDCKFANSFYGIQEAYRLTDMKLWKRTYINKVFGEWVVV